MREKGGRGKKMGESGKRELRKTPEGKLRKGEMGEMVKRKIGERESGETGGGNSFLRGVNKKPENHPLP